MDYSYIFRNKTVVEKKLLDYGFVLKNNIYEYRKSLTSKHLYLLVLIMPIKKEFIVKVMDDNFDDEFISFNIKSVYGEINKEVDEELESIIESCFTDSIFKGEIIKNISVKYNTEPLIQFEESPDVVSFKTINSKKWFLLFMDIEYFKLNKDSKDVNIVNVVNLKLDPSLIDSLVDNKHYFRAYHMNKKYWMTVLLDTSLDLEKFYELVDLSYNLCETKNNKKNWIIPVNPNYYDIEEDFKRTNLLVWPVKNDMKKGDINYIYVSSPVSSIKYILEVVDDKIENPYTWSKKAVLVKLIKRIEHNNISYNFLKSIGIGFIRGPRTITDEQNSKIKELV